MNSVAIDRRIALIALFLLMALVVPATSFAQGLVEKYKLEEFDAKFNSLTNTKGPTYHGAGDDGTFGIALPFDFNYDGTAYTSGTKISANTNGWLEFGASQPAGNPWADRLYPNYKYGNTIYALTSDLITHGGIYSVVQGSAPNRTFVVEWYQFCGYDGYEGWSPITNMQVKLYESTNIIEIVYESPGMEMFYGYSESGTASVGLHGGATFTYLRAFGPTDASMPKSSFRFTPPSAAKPQLTTTPKSINFGSYAAGESSGLFEVTVKNVSTTGTLVIGSATISGTADFTLVSSPKTNSYLPGESGVYTLRFSPIGPNTRSADFSIVSNGADSGSQVVKLTGFGVVPQVAYEPTTHLFRKARVRMGEYMLASTIVRSTGNGPLRVNSVTVSGEYASMYTIEHMPPAIMAAGSVDSVVIRFSPSEEGLRTAQVDIKTNSVSAPDKTILLWGIGTLPRLYMTPGIVRFDSVAMGDTAWTTVRLFNNGSDTLNVKADYVTFADRDFAYFGLDGADSLIAPERFRDVQIRFTPQMRGSRQGRVRFTTNIPMTFEQLRRDTSTFILEVQGTAVPYGLLSIEGQAGMDSALIGSEVCRPVQIWNNGQLPLTVMSADFIGANASEFRISGVTFPLTLAPQTNVSANICAIPNERGLRNANMQLSAMSGDKATISGLDVSVYGLLACATPSTNIAFENEIILVNTTTSAQIMVSNCGDVPAVYTATIDNPAYQLTSPATTAMIAPGENATFDVTFMPTVMGDAAGVLSITSTGITQMDVTLDGIGGNVMIQAENTNAPETAVMATSPEFEVTVSNIGNMELTPGDPTISNAAFAYVAGSGPTTIAAGGSGNYKFTFTPQTSGSHSANVTFEGASPVLAGGFMLNGTTPTGSVRPVAMNGYALGQNYPNPFNPSTTITFTMAEAGNAQIVVSDVTGNIVATVADQFFAKGENKVTFDASQVSSGTYFYELVANGVRLQRSMLLNK